MLRIKKQFFLVILAVFLVSNLHAADSSEILQLTEQHVLDAKVALKKQAQRDRVLKYAVVGAAIGGIGFTLFKVLPGLSDCLKIRADQKRLTRSSHQFAQSIDQLVEGSKQHASLIADFNKSVGACDQLGKNMPKQVVETLLEGYSNCANFSAAHAKLGISYESLSKESLALVAQTLADSLRERDKRDLLARSSWFSGLYWREKADTILTGGATTAAGMVVMPAVLKTVQQKISYLFENKNILSLVRNLSVQDSFTRLEKILAQFAPQEFIKNPNYKNNAKLVADSQVAIASLSRLPNDAQQVYRQALQALIVRDCNALVRQLGYVIAYMRDRPDLDQSQQLVVHNFASQLFQAAGEFALQVKASLDAQDEPGLLNALVLLQAAFNSAVNNFVILTK